MKKWIMILVLAVSVPAMASVNFTATDAGSGKLQIAYTTTDGDLPRGVALKVSLSDGAVVDTSPWNSPIAIVDPMFNAFPDYAYSYPQNFQVGNGHPLAKATEAGVLTADTSEFSICMGVLDQAGSQMPGPASSANLITIQLKMGSPYKTTVTITGDTLRGPASGVVGSVLTSNLPISVLVGNGGCMECIKCTSPIYNDWVKFGKPACWCYARNCKGDADGLKQGSAVTGYWHVGTNDLQCLVRAWQVKEPPKGPGIPSVPNGICCDFGRDSQGSTVTGYWRVGTSDLNILVANWQVKEPPKGPGVSICLDYNFFVNP
jgi:hypothetical protein